MKGFSLISLLRPWRRSCQAFSLIELIVVVGIIAGLTGFIVPKFSTFSQQQTLKTESSRLQSALKNLQNNALSGVVCSSTQTAGKEWYLIFAKDSNNKIYYRTEPDCNGAVSSPSTTFKLADEVTVDSLDSCSNNPIEGRKVSFTNISGVISFNSLLGCPEPSSLTITLRSLKTNQTSQVMIEKGGAIQVK